MPHNHKPQEEGDIAAQKAINQLGACTGVIQELQFAIRGMVDDTIIASNGGENVLSAWNAGSDRVDNQQRFLADLITETIDFMDSYDYELLDSEKRSQYWDALNKITKDTEKLNREYKFFRLLGKIDHTEVTIDFLFQTLKLHKHTFLYRTAYKTLVRRGAKIHSQKIIGLKKRIKCELTAMLYGIEKIMAHSLFADMSPERQNQYHTNWEHYQREISLLDMN